MCARERCEGTFRPNPNPNPATGPITTTTLSSPTATTLTFRCNYVEWDPSGRIVATAVTQPFDGAFYKFQMDNGYKLHTFQGEDFFEKQVLARARAVCNCSFRL